LSRAFELSKKSGASPSQFHQQSNLTRGRQSNTPQSPSTHVNGATQKAGSRPGSSLGNHDRYGPSDKMLQSSGFMSRPFPDSPPTHFISHDYYVTSTSEQPIKVRSLHSGESCGYCLYTPLFVTEILT
jgi:hypothetical protein